MGIGALYREQVSVNSGFAVSQSGQMIMYASTIERGFAQYTGRVVQLAADRDMPTPFTEIGNNHLSRGMVPIR